MKDYSDKTVAEIVAEDYRTASVFHSYGIDFCCKGNRTLDEVCEKKDITPETILQNLKGIEEDKDNTAPDFQTWPLDELADYIEKKHHRYVEEKIPIINQYLEKVAKVHGHVNTELHEIARLFSDGAAALAMHMKKEEMILFPFIRKMAKVEKYNEKLDAIPFGTVQNPVQMMMQEHDTEGERFRKISELSADYNTPDYACNTYKVAFAMLRDFEEDLHLHIHLENNILFPKAIQLEKKLNS